MNSHSSDKDAEIARLRAERDEARCDLISCQDAAGIFGVDERMPPAVSVMRLKAERDRLAGEVERLKKGWDSSTLQAHERAQERDALSAEVERLRGLLEEIREDEIDHAGIIDGKGGRECWDTCLACRIDAALAPAPKDEPCGYCEEACEHKGIVYRCKREQGHGGAHHSVSLRYHPDCEPEEVDDEPTSAQMKHHKGVEDWGEDA